MLTKIDKMATRQPEGEVSVRFPNAVLVAAREDRGAFERRVLLFTLGSLYAQGKISSGLAAQVLGCDRWEFYRLLTEIGLAVLDYSEDDLAYEAETSRRLAAQLAATP